MNIEILLYVFHRVTFAHSFTKKISSGVGNINNGDKRDSRLVLLGLFVGIDPSNQLIQLKQKWSDCAGWHQTGWNRLAPAEQVGMSL
jgi:hypothetical protein